MKTTIRSALYGAAVGGAFGLMRSIIESQPADGLYVPQTTAGIIASHIAYAVPWSGIGAFVGYAIARRRMSNEASQPTIEPNSPAIPTTAVQRFGHVLGWTGNIIGISLVGLGAYGFTSSGGDAFVKGLTVVFGVVAFLIGRALRYIFAGAVR